MKSRSQLTGSVAYKSSQPQPGQRYAVTARCSFPVIFVPVQNDGSGRPATQIVAKTTLFLSPGIKPSSICVPHLRHLGAVFMLMSGLLATAAHRWRRAGGAQYATEKESHRPLHVPVWVISSAAHAEVVGPADGAIRRE